MTNIEEQIRQVLTESGRLAVTTASLDSEADLFTVGLDSLAIVNVLMSLEERFDIELPDEFLSRRSFSNIATIEDIITNLVGHPAGV
jgi:D-alanine--poly(phosphoribitol) ligase subunit 2